MPLFDVPVKITTVASMRIEAATAAEAEDLINCIDVIDVEYVYDVTDAPELDVPTSFLEVSGAPVKVKEGGE